MDLLEIIHPDAVRCAQSVGSKKRLFQDLSAMATQVYGMDCDGVVEALWSVKTWVQRVWGAVSPCPMHVLKTSTA